MFKDKISEIFEKADIKINGSRPWDIQVKDERLFRRIALNGLMGLGDAYVDCW